MEKTLYIICSLLQIITTIGIFSTSILFVYYSVEGIFFNPDWYKLLSGFLGILAFTILHLFMRKFMLDNFQDN